MKPPLCLRLNLFFLFALSAPLHAADLHVPGSYSTITGAVAAAMPGDTIVIASGVYTENVEFASQTGITLQGAGARNTIIDGGAAGPVIYHDGGFATNHIFLNDLTIRNGLGVFGGGIRANRPMTVRRCHIMDNTGNGSPSQGGGVRVGNNMWFEDCTIADNFAVGSGGGLWMTSVARLYMTNCTISGNAATGAGAGIFRVGFSGAGSWNIYLDNCTVVSNSASVGGGYYTDSAVATNLVIRNTIIADNTGGLFPDVGFNILSWDYNLIGSTNGATIHGAQGNNIYNKSAGVTVLQNNGGPTDTHALAPDSEAVDRGLSVGLAADQRGFPRVADFASITNAGNGADIGAFELEADPPVTLAWWRFENDGATVLDSSPYATHSGSLSNMNAGLDDGASGYSMDLPGDFIVDGLATYANTHSLRFDGVDDYVAITGNLPGFDITNVPNQMTLEVFMKLDGPAHTNWPVRFIDMGDATDSNPRTAFSPFFTPFGVGPRPAWTIQPSDAVNFHTAFSQSYAESPFAFDHWHHVAFVKDSTNLYFYLDYQLHSSSTMLDPDGPFTNFTYVTIGNIAPGAVNNDFDGRFDEMRFSAKALAPEEFLHVEGGLPPAFTEITTSPGGDPRYTFISIEGEAYNVEGAGDGLTNGTAFVWDQSIGTYTGSQFRTTLDLPGGVTATVIRVSR